MAKTKELTFGTGRKLSDGEFGSFSLHASETIILEKGDDPKEEHAALVKRVRRRVKDESVMVHRAILKLQAQRRKKLKDG